MRLRARVYADFGGWFYEVRDLTQPVGHQVEASGGRPTWWQAMQGAGDRMRVLHRRSGETP